MVPQLSNKITYILLASDGSLQTVSVRGSVSIKQDHVHPVGERWERQHECVVLHLSSKVTYILLASDGRDRVSAWFCIYQARSHTNCWQVMGETESVHSSATIQQDHV